MAEAHPSPIARSPIRPVEPVRVVAGWEVSGARSEAALRFCDCSPLAKVLLRAARDSAIARALDVPFRGTRRDEYGVLIVGSGPAEWLLLGAPGTAQGIMSGLRSLAGEHVSVVDLTHGRALVRLTGADGARLLSKVCAIDLSETGTPNGAAFRGVVAEVATDVLRDDVAGDRSYLLHCERSCGQYFFGALLDAGAEFGVEVEGFAEGSA